MFQAVGKNKTKTTFIVGMIFLFFAAIVWSITFFLFELGLIVGIIAVVIAFIATFITYWNSDKIVLRIHKARPATPEQDAQLKNILEGLCIAAGVPKPRLYVMEDRALNAFATGRNPKNAVICVTTGLIEELDYYQLEGVVAHELAHIKNYDILLQTVAGIMIGAAIVAARFASRTLMMTGRSSSGGRGGAGALIFVAIGLIFMIIAPIVGQMLKMLLSRNREFLADAKGAEFTRNPEALASALEKIGGSTITLERASNATEGLYIVTPCADMRASMRSKKKKTSVFSTHPPIEKRVEALRNLR
jgi:heat shock protein HtpX